MKSIVERLRSVTRVGRPSRDRINAGPVPCPTCGYSDGLKARVQEVLKILERFDTMPSNGVPLIEWSESVEAYNVRKVLWAVDVLRGDER